MDTRQRTSVVFSTDGIGRETIAVYVKIRVQCFGILCFTLLFSAYAL